MHYRHDEDDKDAPLIKRENPYYGQPIPAYKKGYSLFSASHLPEKITVFGIGQRTQDIYNADVLDTLLGKTVITRTFAYSDENLKFVDVYPAMAYTSDENEERTQIMTDLCSFINNKCAAFILGNEDIDAGYDAFVEELYKMGFDYCGRSIWNGF